MTPLETADGHLADGQLQRAVAELRQLFSAQPTLSLARAVLSRLTHTGAGVVKRKVWVARSYTIEPIFPLLRAGALLEGLDLDIRAGEFNAYAQEILEPTSALYAFHPDVVILAIQTRDLFPALDAAPNEDTSRRSAESLALLENLVAVLRSRSTASIVLFDFAQPVELADGVLDHQVVDGQRGRIEVLNRGIRALAVSMAGVFVLGFDTLVAQIGRARFFDEQKWLTSRMPFAADALWPLAHECLRILLPVTGRVRKVVVVDLDNTLWGGVIGEDGIDGIRIGAEYPGAAHLALQRALLDISRRGVILAIASKNNPADALEVLDSHPAMLLRREHFSAMEISWNDKVESLRKIAGALNVGIDSLVFLDDNPAEREIVRRELPEVLVPELPEDPMQYARLLRSLPSLERMRVSTEDRDRGRQYAEQRARSELKSSAGSLEDFYRSLEMTMQMASLSNATLARISQLTQKTNQFNLTTHRYDEAALQTLASGDLFRVYGCSVQDRFGDNGLVGVAIVKAEADAWEIDTLLLSCRVIGRTVETAMLSFLATKAIEAQVYLLRGWFIPTLKNEPAADFYPRHGFVCVAERDGQTCWEFNLADQRIAWPDWIDNTTGDQAP